MNAGPREVDAFGERVVGATHFVDKLAGDPFAFERYRLGRVQLAELGRRSFCGEILR